MPIPTLDAKGRALSVALLDEAVGPTILPLPIFERVVVVATLHTIARVTALLDAAKPLAPLIEGGPPADRVYERNFSVKPAAEEDHIDFHLLDRPAQNGSPRNDPILRLENFSSGAKRSKAKKGAASKAGPKAEVTSRPPRHRPSPTRAPLAARAADLGPQGRATTDTVTAKAGVGMATAPPGNTRASRAAGASRPSGTQAAAVIPGKAAPNAAAKSPAAKAVARATAPAKAGTQPATKRAAAKGTAPRGGKK